MVVKMVARSIANLIEEARCHCAAAKYSSERTGQVSNIVRRRSSRRQLQRLGRDVRAPSPRRRPCRAMTPSRSSRPFSWCTAPSRTPWAFASSRTSGSSVLAPADPLRSVGDTAVEVTGGPYEEADITEEWCEDQMAAGLTLEEPKPWIREENSSGVRRQKLLSDPQQRSTVRKEMRAHLRYLRGA
jgi:hypothetical protein